MTEPPQIDISNPDSIRDQLNMLPWGYQTQGNTVTAVFCPLCGAMIPAGSADPNDAVRSRVQHVNYHVGIANALNVIVSAVGRMPRD